MSRNHDHATCGFCVASGMRPPHEAQPATSRVEVRITVDAMVVDPTSTASVMAALGDFTNVSTGDREPGVIGWLLNQVEVIP